MRTLIVAAALAALPTVALACSPAPTCWIKEGPSYLRSVCAGYAKDKVTLAQIADFVDEPEKIKQFAAACQKVGVTLRDK